MAFASLISESGILLASLCFLKFRKRELVRFIVAIVVLSLLLVWTLRVSFSSGYFEVINAINPAQIKMECTNKNNSTACYLE
jgi:uncharacterized membrane protein